MYPRAERYEGRGLSRFRTFHVAEFFRTVRTLSDVSAAFADAEKLGKSDKIFVIGRGSNVFFKRTKIKSFLIKNSLPQEIRDLGGGRFEVSSSVEILRLLKEILKQSRDGPYYLAAAPCQVGGAIAMNAGSGPKDGKSVSDFLESVKVFRGGRIATLQKKDMAFSYRDSNFLHSGPSFIISAVFFFPEGSFDGNPIEERLKWSAVNQDMSRPNCGSLCNKYDARIMRFARALFRVLKFPAGLSYKKLNWAYNTAKNPVWLRIVLGFLRVMHRVFCREIKFEIRIVD